MSEKLLQKGQQELWGGCLNFTTIYENILTRFKCIKPPYEVAYVASDAVFHSTITQKMD